MVLQLCLAVYSRPTKPTAYFHGHGLPHERKELFMTFLFRVLKPAEPLTFTVFFCRDTFEIHLPTNECIHACIVHTPAHLLPTTYFIQKRSENVCMQICKSNQNSNQGRHKRVVLVGLPGKFVKNGSALKIYFLLFFPHPRKCRLSLRASGESEGMKPQSITLKLGTLKQICS